MIKKLILGTANFDLNYGLKNRFKKLKKKEIKKIIYYSKKKILIIQIQHRVIKILKKYLEEKTLINSKLLQNLLLLIKVMSKNLLRENT